MYLSEYYMHELYDALNEVPDVLRMKNKSVLITGATGLIGSYIVDLLLALNRRHEANIRVYALGRSAERLRLRFDDWNDLNLVYVEQDVNKPLTCQAGFDFIIHAASNAYPAAFSRYPVDTIISNTIGTINLLECARLSDSCRFVFVSSGEVYGQTQDLDMVFEESFSGYVDPLDSRFCYPNSKRLGETLCVSYLQQYQTDAVIVRPCHVYGPYTTDSDNRASTQFVNSVLRKEPIVLQSLGIQRRSYCYVADCATAIITAMLNGESGEAYNIANSLSVVTIAELAREIADQGGQRVVFQLTDEAQKEACVKNQILSNKRIEALGWKGRYTLKQGITHTLRIRKEWMSK